VQTLERITDYGHKHCVCMAYEICYDTSHYGDTLEDLTEVHVRAMIGQTSMYYGAEDMAEAQQWLEDEDD